jgi:hypothetical protein
MIILKSDISTIKNFASEALSSRLYVEGFQLKKALEKTLFLPEKQLKDSFILLLKETPEGPALGVSTFLTNEYCTVQTFVKHENRGFGYAFKLIEKLMNEIPLSLKNKAKFCLGETASLFLFRSLMLKGILSDINFIDETVKLKLNILDTYIFCKKHNLNIQTYVPNWNKIFNQDDISIINTII